MFFFFKQKTAYEMRISDWSSDVCSSDLIVYTQPKSVEAYRSTGHFPDGTVLVKELYEGASDDLTTGRVSWSGKAAGWFVMVKDDTNRFSGNPLWGDGWGWSFFEAGAPDEPVTPDYQAEIGRAHVCNQVTNEHIVCRLQ